VTKWKKVATCVMKARRSQHVRNELASKDKWGALNDDFEYMVGTNHDQHWYS
jgi:hypothetical protein